MKYICDDNKDSIKNFAGKSIFFEIRRFWTEFVTSRANETPLKFRQIQGWETKEPQTPHQFKLCMLLPGPDSLIG